MLINYHGGGGGGGGSKNITEPCPTTLKPMKRQIPVHISHGYVSFKISHNCAGYWYFAITCGLSGDQNVTNQTVNTEGAIIRHNF